VYHIVADYTAADGDVPTAHEHAHEGADPDEDAHPADGHTDSHPDGHAGPADRDADAAHGDAPAGNPYGVRSGV
jgi:hypothetical protein